MKRLILLAMCALPAAAFGQSHLPPGAVFPPRDPDTAGVVNAYAGAVALQMMFCGLRSQRYADIITDAVNQLLSQEPEAQTEKFFATNGHGQDFRHMNLPSCQTYQNDPAYAALVSSMDDFVARVNNQ